jgi:hypothetical protein
MLSERPPASLLSKVTMILHLYIRFLNIFGFELLV